MAAASRAAGTTAKAWAGAALGSTSPGRSRAGRAAVRRTIRRWVQQGTFPAPVKLGGGGLARWRLSDVEQFVAALATRV
jgi:hypothetical protein